MIIFLAIISYIILSGIIIVAASTYSYEKGWKNKKITKKEKDDSSTVIIAGFMLGWFFLPIYIGVLLGEIIFKLLSKGDSK